MKDEAEKLARELDDFNASLDRKAAKMIRSQAADLVLHRELLVKHLAEIDPLREKVKSQAAEIERLKYDEGTLKALLHIAREGCQRKDALLREALAALKDAKDSAWRNGDLKVFDALHKADKKITSELRA